MSDLEESLHTLHDNIPAAQEIFLSWRGGVVRLNANGMDWVDEDMQPVCPLLQHEIDDLCEYIRMKSTRNEG